MDHNPFVYGEVVPAAAFVEPRRRAGPAGRRPRRRAEGLPDLAAPVRQVVAHPAGARGSGPAGRADRRGHGQQLQLVRGVSRGLRAGADGGRNPMGSRAHLAARKPSGSARAEVRYTPGESPLGSLTVSFPSVRSDRDVSRLAQEVFALAGPPGRSPPTQGRRRARRVSGDRRIQRRLGRARDARGRPASARGRIRVCRLGAEPDGADAQAEAAVLQSGSGDAAREDSRPTNSPPSIDGRFSRSGLQAGARSRRCHRRSRRQPALRRPAPRARDLGRGALGRPPARHARRSCTRRCAACSPSRRRCSRRSGSV